MPGKLLLSLLLLLLLLLDETGCHATAKAQEAVDHLTSFLSSRVEISQLSNKFLGIVGEDPSDSKSNWLHADIFRFCSVHLRYILLKIPLK
jgi:hypothetical protein